MDLLHDYMNEHYAAARNHQTMRVQAMALYVSAASILFVQAILHYNDPVATSAIGIVMLILAFLCYYQNTVFHRANRYHVEVSKQSRKQITKILKGGTSHAQNDPNLIGNVVRANLGIKLKESEFEDQLQKAYNETLKVPPFRVENWLHQSLLAIPLLIGFGGILLIGYSTWITKLICLLCRQP